MTVSSIFSVSGGVAPLLSRLFFHRVERSMNVRVNGAADQAEWLRLRPSPWPEIAPAGEDAETARCAPDDVDDLLPDGWARHHNPPQ
jgi:hypothetical protein